MGLFQSKIAVVAPPFVDEVLEVVPANVIDDNDTVLVEEDKIGEIVIISPIIDDIVPPFVVDDDDDIVRPFVEAMSKKKKRRKSKD